MFVRNQSNIPSRNIYGKCDLCKRVTFKICVHIIVFKAAFDVSLQRTKYVYSKSENEVFQERFCFSHG